MQLKQINSLLTLLCQYNTGSILNSNHFEDGLVSVVIPTFNSEDFIYDAIQSVLNQDYKNIEILVSDDCSTDNTLDILEDLYLRESKIKIIRSSSNNGAAVARNKALEISNGQFIAFIDSDDLWKKNKLSTQINFMKDKNIAFSFTCFRRINKSGKYFGKVLDMKCPDKVSYEDMLAKKATLGCSTVVIDQSIVGRIAMPLLRRTQDYALWLSILKRDIKAFPVKKHLVDIRFVPGSLSSNKFLKSKRQWDIYRNYEKLSIIESFWYFINYAFRAIFRP